MSQEASKTESSATENEFAWLLRPCKDYQEELKECRRWRSRFHQYFIFGETVDCSAWAEDYRNCKLFEQSGNPQTLEKIVSSERSRISARLTPHYSNTVWEHRDQPPPNWAAELPDNLKERNKDSYLVHAASEAKKASTGGNGTAAAGKSVTTASPPTAS